MPFLKRWVLKLFPFLQGLNVILLMVQFVFSEVCDSEIPDVTIEMPVDKGFG